MKRHTPFLSTKRLIMKKGVYNDYLIVYEYDFRKLRNIAGEFVFEKLHPSDIDGFDTYAEDNEDVYDWIIYLKRSGSPIGNIVADRYDEQTRSVEISFNIHPSYWGHEYIEEAALCVIDFLFKTGINEIWCSYSEGNIKSKRAIEKMGFKYYETIENAWKKGEWFITDYKYLLEKKDFYEIKSKY